jgi:hypothetical protein
MGRTLVDKIWAGHRVGQREDASRHGFPGGAGLVSAGVFGRLAGRTAATESVARAT